MKNNKKTLFYSIIAAAIIITIAVGITYSVFTIGVEDNNNNKTTSATSGNSEVQFVTDRYIDNTNMYLIKDSDVESKADYTEFNVSHKSTSTLKFFYYISLTELSISNNLIDQDFKWQVLKDDVLLESGNFSNAESGTPYSLTADPILLEVGETDNIKLRVWLSETKEDQGTLQNGTFSAKVEITSIR